MSLTKIPEMDCDPIYSILRLPRNIRPSLDVTNLGDIYGFDTSCFSLTWDHKKYDIDINGDIYESTGEDCSVDVPITTTGKCTYISFLSAAIDNEVEGGKWVLGGALGEMLPCSVTDDGGSDSGGGSDTISTYPAPVSYATNRPTFLPSPTFNPNQAAGGGGGDTAYLNGPLIGRVESIDRDARTARVNLYTVTAGGVSLSEEEITVRVM